jgi:hypothetical protein
MSISAKASKILKYLRMFKIDAATLNTRRATPTSQVNKSYLNDVANAAPRTAKNYPEPFKTLMAELVAAAPVISSFTPTSAAGASSGGVQQVVITGLRLTGATAVTFGGVAAASFVVNSATQITAQVAAGSKSGNVAVKTPDGDAIKSGFTFLKRPTISSFTPTTAATAASVVIYGTNFTGTTGASGVTFGGTNATSYVVNFDHQITAVVPAGTSGSVVVTNTGGTATKTGFTHS